MLRPLFITKINLTSDELDKVFLQGEGVSRIIAANIPDDFPKEVEIRINEVYLFNPKIGEKGQMKDIYRNPAGPESHLLDLKSTSENKVWMNGNGNYYKYRYYFQLNGFDWGKNQGTPITDKIDALRKDYRDKLKDPNWGLYVVCAGDFNASLSTGGSKSVPFDELDADTYALDRGKID